MTLSVRLRSPQAALDLMVAHPVFSPMPEARGAAAGAVGNGPFVLDTREPERVTLAPNPGWDGTRYDPALALPRTPSLDRLAFVTTDGPADALAAFEAGEVQATTVRHTVTSDDGDRPDPLDTPVAGSDYLVFNLDRGTVAGAENEMLRRAIALAIDREAVTAVAPGAREVATGLTPPGVPGFAPGLCDHCSHDPVAAHQALADWQAAGHTFGAPIGIRFVTWERVSLE